MPRKDYHQVTIGEALKQFIDKHRLSAKLTETWLTENWASIMGATIAKHTTLVQLKGTTVHIYLNSPVLRQELVYNKAKVLELINKEAGYTAAEDVVVR